LGINFTPSNQYVKKNLILPIKRRFLMEQYASGTPRKVLYYIFRTWVTRKDGTRDYARDHGFRAWRIPVYSK
jgi:hypothetical protein